ncbi:MAG: hypothetical protein ACFE0S_04530 [Rhodospirillales bacterium]
MAGRALRVTVLHSVNNNDGSLCVDVFRRPDGSIGFEEYRRDVEDPSGWFAVGGYAEARYNTAEAAIGDAVESVIWFKGI